MKLFSYKDVVGPLYFVDPDLKEQFPKHPKLIPNIVPFNAGKSTLQFMGSYTSFALYNVSNRELAKNFICLCDGSRTLEEILEALPEVEEKDKRNLLAMLFRNGLLEEGAGQEITTDTAFFSQLVDHTRLNSNGQQAVDRVNRTSLSIIGPESLSEDLAESFLSSGLKNVLVNKVNFDVDIYLIINGGSTTPVAPDLLITNRQTKILINLCQHTVEFGPVLNAMTDSVLPLAEKKREASQESLTDTQRYQIVYRTLLYLSKCNISKIHSYAAVIGPNASIGTEYGIRSKYFWSVDSASGPCQADKEVMDHYAAISVPPMDDLGGKIHEHHSSQMNLVAYQEKPMALYSREKIVLQEEEEAGVDIADLVLLKDILNKTFGYRHLEYGPKRIAPSGGDLGVTEAIITGVEGTSTVYRYHGISNTLEVLRNAEGGIASQKDLSIYFYSNVEKAKRKYGRFGENLVWLDAGISLNYIQNLAGRAGYHMSWQRCDERLPKEMQFLSNKTHEFLYIVKLLRADEPLESRGDINALIDVRRAARNFSKNVVPKGVVEALVAAARCRFRNVTANQQALSQMLCSNISLLALENGKITKYSLNLVQPSSLINNSCGSQEVDLSNLVNQTTLSSSPLKFVVVLDMHREITPMLDLALYKSALSVAASVVMELWFEALAQKLIACPAGGLSPHSLLDQVDAKHRDFIVLFTLCLGEEEKNES